jgi:small subunit ribosomal protein S6
MRYYEILYIVNPNFERKIIDNTMKEIDSRLKETKSKIINHSIWGKKKLAYTIQGHKYGTYVLLHYESGDQKKLDEFDSWLKLSDLVIRHMIVKLDRKPDIIKTFDETLSERKKEDSEAEKTEDQKESEENNDKEKKGAE